MTRNLSLVLLALALAALLQPCLALTQSDSSAGAGAQRAAGQTAGAPKQAPMPDMTDMPGMPAGRVDRPITPPAQPWCDGQAWSIFNHRMSGWFLLLWGLTALVAGLQWPRRTWTRFVPPMILFGLAEFLFFRNDPEAWPVGPMTFWASLHDPEDLQHRVFLLLVILLAVIELVRAADRLPNILAKYSLPILGAFGATLLFFHKHGGPEMAAAMSGTASGAAMQRAMASMDMVRHEHLWFSILGFGFAAAKLLADAGYLRGRRAALWSIFAVLLGGYMIGYVE